MAIGIYCIIECDRCGLQVKVSPTRITEVPVTQLAELGDNLKNIYTLPNIPVYFGMITHTNGQVKHVCEKCKKSFWRWWDDGKRKTENLAKD